MLLHWQLLFHNSYLPKSLSITVRVARPFVTPTISLVMKHRNVSSASLTVSSLSGSGTSTVGISILIVTVFIATPPAKSAGSAGVVGRGYTVKE